MCCCEHINWFTFVVLIEFTQFELKINYLMTFHGVFLVRLASLNANISGSATQIEMIVSALDSPNVALSNVHKKSCSASL